MERLLSWLDQPLWPGGGIRLWMAIGAGLVLLAAIIFNKKVVAKQKTMCQ